MIVREANENDLPILLQFEQGVIAAERPFDPTLKPDPVHYYDLIEMLSAPHIHLVVAELDNKVVASGYARIETARHFVKHHEHAYLGFMYTLPEYRGRGINMKILDELRRWSLSHGISEMQLEVYNDNSPAIKAYEKAGFVRHMITMRRSVD